MVNATYGSTLAVLKKAKWYVSNILFRLMFGGYLAGTGHRGLPQTYRVYSAQFPVGQNPSFRAQRLRRSINKGTKQFTAF